jgi:zinc transport system permease protein
VSDFLEAVLTHAFMRNALLTGVLASVACGVIGTYVVVRRISYIAGGIAHSVLGGIGAALYLQRVHGVHGLDPLHGALVAAILAAFIIGFVSLRAKERVDTVIGAVWAVGMASGILFLSRTPGYGEDLMSYLFGNILMVRVQDLWLIAALDVVVVAAGLLFYNEFLAIAFDEEFARVRGVNVDFYFLFLLLLTALTVVLLVSVVGIVMVIALLTIPAAVAGRIAGRLSQMMALSVLVCASLCTGGLAISYRSDLPAGATIILLAGVLYLAVVISSRAWNRRRAAVANRNPTADRSTGTEP